ncbi:hypothetical protein B296_00015933 [Ensete ventricosum]|uniref:Uncharacterized protein n=1 Tax=Ensete ventricosum TaxID=4639 RepID=A0A427B605_ENSVE|nr:hypothetical protein B296_00015933 [Ensete ventricosum]
MGQARAGPPPSLTPSTQKERSGPHRAGHHMARLICERTPYWSPGVLETHGERVTLNQIRWTRLEFATVHCRARLNRHWFAGRAERAWHSAGWHSWPDDSEEAKLRVRASVDASCDLRIDLSCCVAASPLAPHPIRRMEDEKLSTNSAAAGKPIEAQRNLYHRIRKLVAILKQAGRDPRGGGGVVWVGGGG